MTTADWIAWCFLALAIVLLYAAACMKAMEDADHE